MEGDQQYGFSKSGLLQLNMDSIMEKLIIKRQISKL
jgi:hypothetical protein